MNGKWKTTDIEWKQEWLNNGINISDKMWEKQRKLLKSYQRDKDDYL